MDIYEKTEKLAPVMGPSATLGSTEGVAKEGVLITPSSYVPRENLNDLRILIVDDNRFQRSVTKSALSVKGIFGFGEANSARAAVDSLRENTFDLIVIDNNMPDETGIEFTRRIRQGETGANVEIPVIMVSSSGEASMIAEARNAGVHEFVLKPFSVTTLMERIRTTFKYPRKFIRTPGYVGPDRRWRDVGSFNGVERRTRPDV
ncbi:MAG: response regulator [Rhodospirillales bacterium]|nr:response regulator [Rhodospirillales bacterium]